MRLRPELNEDSGHGRHSVSPWASDSTGTRHGLGFVGVSVVDIVMLKELCHLLGRVQMAGTAVWHRLCGPVMLYSPIV